MAKRTKGKIQSKFYAKTRQEWQTWLEDNQESTSEIWLIFYRPHTERQNVGYKESLEVAASFGWKQTLIKRLDDDSYARKFVPLSALEMQKRDEQKQTVEETVEPEIEKKEDVILIPISTDDLEPEIIDDTNEKYKDNSIEKTKLKEPDKKIKVLPPTVVEIKEEKEIEDEESDEYLTFESEFGKEDIDSEESEDIYENVEWKTVQETSESEETEMETEDDLTFQDNEEELETEAANKNN